MSARIHRYLAERVFGEPVMISEPKLHQVMGVLLDGSYQPYEPEPEEDDNEDDNEPEDLPIEVICVHGSLVKRTMGIDAMSGLCSYVDLESQLLGAAAAGKDILLDIDSPGGEAMGVFSLCGVISEVRKQGRRVYCVASPAYSAAYAIASVCDRIYMPSDSEVGSIGVIAAHLDVSEAEKKAGVKYTLVTAGEHKADLSPHKPLSPGAKDRLQEKVDTFYLKFVALVAQGRGISEQEVIDTQADTMGPDKALPKFADRIGGLREAMADMRMEMQTELGAEKPVAAGMAMQREMSSGLIRCDGAANPLQVLERAGKTIISGILAPYNSPSSVLAAGFREIYEPGCFADSLNADIRFCVHHDETQILGRTSADTLRLFDSVDGLRYECELPDTTYARDLQASMARGDIGGASAAFYLRPGGYRMETTENESYRLVSKAQLIHGSVVVEPAYPAATAQIDQQQDSAQPIGPAAADTAAGHLETLLRQIELAGQL